MNQPPWLGKRTFGLLLVTLILLVGLGLAASQARAAAQFFVTSFEQVDTTATNDKYQDTNCTDHALVNLVVVNPNPPPANIIMPPVTHPNTADTTGATELGFTSDWTNTRGLVDCTNNGLGDGNNAIGVVSLTNALGVDTGAFVGHDQAYVIEDSDGRVTVTLQGVSCEPNSTINVSAEYYVNSTSYAATDQMRIWVEVDGTPTNLLNVPDMAAFFNGGGGGTVESWTTVSATGLVGDVVVIRFMADVGTATKEVFFDSLVIDCGAPTAVSMQSITTAVQTGDLLLFFATILLGLVALTILTTRQYRQQN